MSKIKPVFKKQVPVDVPAKKSLIQRFIEKSITHPEQDRFWIIREQVGREEMLTLHVETFKPYVSGDRVIKKEEFLVNPQITSDVEAYKWVFCK